MPTEPDARREPAKWLAHLALIVVAVAVVASLAGRGDRSLLRGFSIGVLIALVILFIVQSFRGHNAGGALGKWTAYALTAAGALFTLLTRFASSQSTIFSLALFSALFYIGGFVGFAIQAIDLRRRGPRDTTPEDL